MPSHPKRRPPPINRENKKDGKKAKKNTSI